VYKTFSKQPNRSYMSDLKRAPTRRSMRTTVGDIKDSKESKESKENKNNKMPLPIDLNAPCAVCSKAETSVGNDMVFVINAMILIIKRVILI